MNPTKPRTDEEKLRRRVERRRKRLERLREEMRKDKELVRMIIENKIKKQLNPSSPIVE